MTTELIQVNPTEFGLEESQANNMVSGLLPVLEERKVLIEMYGQIIGQEITPALVSEAKKLRIKIKENRTKGITPWHKVNKEVFLRGGQFVDAINRRETQVNTGMEDKLEEIETYFENLEKERIAKLTSDREAEVSQYGVDTSSVDLGTMSEQAYSMFLSGAKVQHEAKIEAERKAEEKRIEDERRQKVYQERRVELATYSQFMQEGEGLTVDTTDEAYADFIRVLGERKQAWEKEQAELKAEQERLRKEAEEREEQMKKEREEAEAKLREEREKAEAERKRVEAEEAEKRRVIEEQARREREDAEAERKRLEDELKAKKDAEEKAEADRLAALEAEASKGDADKVKDLIADLEAIGKKYAFKSKKNQTMYTQVQELIGKVIAHIEKQ